MSKISVDLSKFAATVEGDADKVLSFLTSADAKISASAPKALAALGVLAGGVETALGDASAAAANPGSLLINFGSDLTAFKAVWPDVKSFLGTLGIKV